MSNPDQIFFVPDPINFNKLWVLNDFKFQVDLRTGEKDSRFEYTVLKQKLFQFLLVMIFFGSIFYITDMESGDLIMIFRVSIYSLQHFQEVLSIFI